MSQPSGSIADHSTTDMIDVAAMPSQPDPPPLSELANSADIILDLPAPLSVNKLRRINWRTHKQAALWKDMADRFLLVAKTRKVNPVKLKSIKRFELFIMLDENLVSIDLDNTLKLLIDFLRHRNVIEDDSPKHMRKLTVEWGRAPDGVRVTVRPWL
jgi:Holliday junction resolvase RusA-like endonuclease